MISTESEIQEMIEAAYRTVCASPPGRTMLEHLAVRFFLGSTTMVPGDAVQTGFNEGCRFVLLYIMEMGGLTKLEDVVACLKK
jgi:hypothetical protein